LEERSWKRKKKYSIASTSLDEAMVEAKDWLDHSFETEIDI